MTEQRTFDRLRQLPLDDMISALKAKEFISTADPWINNMTITGARMNDELAYHYERVKCLKDGGWEFEEFVLAVEKRDIDTLLKEMNESIEFKFDKLKKRMARFYPTAEFIPGSIRY